MFFVFDTDPRVNDWPLMDSPFPTLFMVITYLYIVTYLGPKVMANRKPFKLNNVLVLYNAGQVVFSFVMLWEVGSSVNIKMNNVHYGFRTQTSCEPSGIELERTLSSIRGYVMNGCKIKTSFWAKQRKSMQNAWIYGLSVSGSSRIFSWPFTL